MANLGPTSSRAPGGQLAPPVGQVIARYATYGEAQRAVDYLSDNRFPVQAVTIVGTDLRSVERVTGRLTYGRVALAGALSGAWFGLFVGLLLSLFAGGPDAGVPAAILIGAGFGMLFGVITYAAAGGRRDFTSQSAIVANEYQVLCREEQARAAIEVLGRLPHANHAGAPPAPGVRYPSGEPVVRQPPGEQNGSAGPAAGSNPFNPYAPPPGTAAGAPPADTVEGPLPPVGDPGAAAPDPYQPVGPLNPASAGSGPESATPGVPAAASPPAASAAPPVPTGLTYGEVMAQRKREQREREAAERAERARRAAEGEQ